MKKYFMTGTDDELEYGDIIKVDLSKGKKHEHIECKFHPALVGILLDEGIIEIRDVEEKEEEEEDTKDFLEFDDDDDIIGMLNEVLEMQEEQAKLLDKLTDRLIELEGVIADLSSLVKDE